METTPFYWLHKPANGLYELRQTRYKAQFIATGKDHPHDVCAYSRSVQEMRDMVKSVGLREVDWGTHAD